VSAADSARYTLGIIAAVAGIGFGIITLVELVGGGPEGYKSRSKAAQPAPTGVTFYGRAEYVAPGVYE